MEHMFHIAHPGTFASLFVFNTLLIVSTVALHYEAIHWLAFNECLRRLSPRSTILVSLLVLILCHCAEVWIWAFGYAVLDYLPNAGSFVGSHDRHLLDHVYFSFTSYTTVGFGDIAPTGHIRFTSSMESLIGLILIAWSASYLLFVMQKLWGTGRH